MLIDLQEKCCACDAVSVYVNGLLTETLNCPACDEIICIDDEIICIDDETICIDDEIICIDDNCTGTATQTTCVAVVTDGNGCQTLICDVTITNGVCEFICPDNMECNRPYKLELKGCVCKRCEWSVQSAPSGGGMRFYRSGTGVIAVADTEGQYVIRACCLD